MKRIILAISILSLMFTIPVFAATSALSDGTGTITLTDATGGGPGVIGVAVSNDSYVAYTGDTGAGGYTANTTGQTMAAQAYSKKADKDVQLLFAVRSSQVAGDTDDNSVYQDPAGGTAFTAASISLTTDYSTSTDF